MSVLIAIPCYGGIADRTLTGVFNLGKLLQSEGIDHDLVTVANSSLISHGRSRIANTFLHQTKFDNLLFIDADIGFRAHDALKLLELNAPVAAAPYTMKTLPPRYHFTATLKNGQPLANDEKTAIQVEQIGAGFMMIQRGTFEKLSTHFPELHYVPSQGASNRTLCEGELRSSYHYFETYIDPESRAMLSEDIAFCRRCRAIGLEIWMRIDTQLSHTGSHEFLSHDLAAELKGALG